MHWFKINLSKLVNLLISALFFFHSLHIVVLGLLLISPLVALLSPLVLKLQIDRIIILLVVLWNSVLSDLRHVADHATPSPI